MLIEGDGLNKNISKSTNTIDKNKTNIEIIYYS
jgi:hypothetical protein